MTTPRSDAVNSDEAWFWTESWQQGEHEATEDVAAHQVTVYRTAREFLASLRG